MLLSTQSTSGALYSPGGLSNGEDVPNDPGKMFIGGLSWQTTPESIREYFSQFGDLAEVMVMKDPATRRSRGFGFITFCEPEAVDKVLGVTHTLDGKIVEPKIAVPRKSNPKFVMRTKKIFVGGLSASTSLEDIKSYFEQFCTVKDAMLALDKVTHRHRGFGFVTFDNEDVVDKICEIHFHDINGKMVESKKALPKEPRPSFYGSYGHHPFSSYPYTYHTRPNGGPNFYNRFSAMYRGPYGGGGGGVHNGNNSNIHTNNSSNNNNNNTPTGDPFLYDNSPRYFRYPDGIRNYNNSQHNNNATSNANGTPPAAINGYEMEYHQPIRSLDAATAAAMYAQSNNNNNASSNIMSGGGGSLGYRLPHGSNQSQMNRNNSYFRSDENNYYSHHHLATLDNYIHAAANTNSISAENGGENYEEDFPELTSKFSQFRFEGKDGDHPGGGSSSSPNTPPGSTSNNPSSNNMNSNHYGF